MAKISSTVSYPIIAPDGDDYFILTDAENDNATKNCSVNNLASYLAVDTVNVSVEISPANLKVLGDVSYTVLVSPGAGYVYKIIQAVAFLDYGTAPFSFASNAILSMGAYYLQPFSSSFLNLSADSVYTVSTDVGGIITADTPIILTGVNSATGDSSLIINITYQKLKLDSTF